MSLLRFLARFATQREYDVKVAGGNGLLRTIRDGDTLTVEMPMKLSDSTGKQLPFCSEVTFWNDKGTLRMITPTVILKFDK